MSDKVILIAEERSIKGKKVKQLRKDGFVPGVVYGQDQEPMAVTASAVAATKAWRAAGKHHPIELTIGSKKELALIKSADIDPVKHLLRHLSLHVIRQNEAVETEVPVKIMGEGETPAEKAGLVVLQALETVEIKALPAKLPDFMQIPGDKLTEQGDHVTVGDILPVAGVELQTDPTIVVASVYEPGALAAQNDKAAGDATADTEVASENGSEETASEADKTAGAKESK